MNMKKTFKLLGNEFKINSINGIMISIAIWLISSLPVFLNTEITGPTNPMFSATVVQGVKEGTSFSLISRCISQATLFSLFTRMTFVLKDKSTLDKNRVAYLTNKPHVVSFAKVLPDILFFILPILLVEICAYPIIISKGGIFKSDVIPNIVAMNFSIMFTYAITTLGMRFISTLRMRNTYKGFVLGLFVLSTLGVTIISSVVFGILGSQRNDLKQLTDSAQSIQTFFKDNQIWLAIIPIFNFITPFMGLYGFMKPWTFVPLIVEIIIAIGIIWLPLSKKLKEYLTT